MPFGWMGKILEVDLTTKKIGHRQTMTYAPNWTVTCARASLSLINASASAMPKGIGSRYICAATSPAGYPTASLA